MIVASAGVRKGRAYSILTKDNGVVVTIEDSIGEKKTKLNSWGEAAAWIETAAEEQRTNNEINGTGHRLVNS